LFKKILLNFFFTIVFVSYSFSVFANDKKNIIDKLKNINSLKFNFNQKTNDLTEIGICYLYFPGKLKCNYNSADQKEIIINKSSLVIIKKKYDKKYYYPISKSPFLKILNKKELIKLIKKGNIEYQNNRLSLVNIFDDQVITIFFGKKNFDFSGWEVTDQFGKKISFSIKILSVNDEIDIKMFKIPNLN
tara:strand:+ start:255 stop:821 length:567 start_codon:yes stop_codon:yes gene_type:complete